MIRQYFKLKCWIVLGILSLVFTHSLQAQIKMDPTMDRHYDSVSNYVHHGFPETGLKYFNKHIKNKVGSDQEAEYIKAQVFEMLLLQYKSESDQDLIIGAEKAIAQASSPTVKAIWQAIAADFYYNYFQSNQYQIYQRTNIGSSGSTQIDEWTAAQFFTKIDELFTAALLQKAALRGVPIADYQAILTSSLHTGNLRPTLYELVAHKAQKFYRHNDLQRIKPTNEFQMDDPRYFGNAVTFIIINLKNNTTDTNSNMYKSMILFQDLMFTHRAAENVEALLDVDIDRLDWVFEKSILSDKIKYYYQALLLLETNYPATIGGAKAKVKRLNLLATADAATMNILEVKRTKKEIEAAFIAIKNAHKDDEAGALASIYLSAMTTPNLSMQVEQVLLPNENNKIFAQYKNVQEVYFTLYKIPAASLLLGDNYYTNLEQYVNKRSITKHWKATLPQGLDLEQHSTELLMEPLGFGTYLLVAHTTEKIDSLKYAIGYNRFQVSNLTTAYIQSAKDPAMFVLDRTSGQAISAATVTFYEWVWDNKKRKNRNEQIKSVTSSSDGSIDLLFKTANYKSYNTVIVKGADTLLSDYYTQQYYERESDHRNSIILTDRSIYRPGQLLYFKGILFDITDKGKQNQVVPNQKMNVVFRDANYQEIKTLSLETNEFGSYHGQFEIPEGLINGSFSISDGLSTASVAIEEYKRPKFFAVFDKISDSYALNEKVIIKGKATAFAGNAISDAAVKYRVVREVRFPYSWYYYDRPQWMGGSKEISIGTTTTQADGSFEIPFDLSPDLSVDKKSNPLFHYSIYADVTDINGETHAITTSMSAGYQSFVITASVPAEMKKDQLKNIQVNTQNLQGEKLTVPLDIAIYKLDFPGLFRKRYWSKPEVQSYTQEEYRRLFPNDEYENESDPLAWKTAQRIQDWKQLLVNENPIEINTDNFKENGFYLIELSGKSSDGSLIKDKKTFHLFDNDLKGNPEKPLLSIADQSSVQPGDVVEVLIGSAFGKDANIKTLTSNSDKTELLKDNTRSITREITERDRGGISYSHYLVFNNRVYLASQTIAVPWKNKQLDITWATHRDKLLPGADESWTMNITGNKKEKLAVELLSVLYDASLDALKPHSYAAFNNLYSNHYMYASWDSRNNYQIASHNRINSLPNPYSGIYFQKVYAALFTEGSYLYNNYNSLPISTGESMEFLNSSAIYGSRSPSPSPKAMRSAANGDEPVADMAVAEPASGKNFKKTESTEATLLEQKSTSENATTADVKLRSNFNETAYFLPQLKTNEQGDVVINFSLPESLTQWKMMSYAHTKDMRTGFLEGTILAQKDLMVQPNMPRFFRQNDQVVLSTKIVNLTKEVMNGNVTLEIVDPYTEQLLDISFKHTEKTKRVHLNAEGATEVHWVLDIPEARYEPVLVRIKARAGSFTDGEEHLIPVLTNRTLVTETKPLPIRGSGTFDFSMEKLKNNQSTSLLHRSFTIEYTANPAWYAIQALPYLMDYPHECAEQTFNKWYATAISRSIVANTPAIENVFKEWQKSDTAALLSNLEKNQELKSALLQETPWVLAAKNESEQKQLIGKLFEKKNIEKQFNRWLKRMEQLQQSDGSWSWFPGMQSSDFITQYIVTGFGKLNKVNAIQLKSEAKVGKMAKEGLDFLDRRLVKEFEELKRYNKEWKKLDNISPLMVNFFYMRSFYKDVALTGKTKEAYDFYYAIAKKNAARMAPYQKAQMALVTFRNNENTMATSLIKSLKETSLNNEEMGMYWKGMPNGYYWYEANIEAQALLIEAFSEVTNDEQAVNDMKTWLLKQKQTQDWGTTKATADACYALIMKGENWLAPNPEVTIAVGNQSYNLDDKNTEAGTGYFKKVIEGKAVNNSFGDIQVAVTQPQESLNRVSWGAVYWQYFEDMDKITATASPLSVSKQLFIKKNSSTGPQLFEVNNDEKLKVGDRLTVRITIRLDRDMEYIHLKDMRAAAFEPIDVLSGYNYSNGLGFYRSNTDAAMNFFFDRINKGTYVLEYDLFVNAKGAYSNGISTIQSMYAPEFGAHTEGLRVEVE